MVEQNFANFAGFGVGFEPDLEKILEPELGVELDLKIYWSWHWSGAGFLKTAGAGAGVEPGSKI